MQMILYSNVLKQRTSWESESVGIWGTAEFKITVPDGGATMTSWPLPLRLWNWAGM